jgi:hypothetical protein
VCVLPSTRGWGNDAAGAALSPGTKNLGVKSRQQKGRIRMDSRPATKTAEAFHAQCRQLRLVEDCGWTGRRATHPRPSRRRGRRKARRRRAAEDGLPERPSSAPLRQKLVGAPREVVPDHTPRSSADSWRRVSQPGRKAAPQRGRHWQGPRRRRRPPEHSGLCNGGWGRWDV